MNDEVRDMIKSTLVDEPPSGLEFERVLADGRRRRARRRYGALTATAAGIGAVVAVTVLVIGTGGRATTSPPAQQLSTVPTTTPSVAAAPGCTTPSMTGGFPDLPSGTASPGELAESGRLTEAFKQFALPLPAGVQATPLELCVVKESWGGWFTVTGDRSVSVYVRPRGGQPTGECVTHGPGTECSIKTLPDGSTARVMISAMSDATLVDVDAWRQDGTFVSVMETGSQGSTNRVLSDDQLVAIATAPQLKVLWTSDKQVPAAPSDRRAAELGAVLAAAVPAGLRPEAVPGNPGGPLQFRVAQGGYRALANLSDAAGTGWVMVNVEKPGEGAVDCGGRATCELVELSGGRKAAVDSETEGSLSRLSLIAKAADGTSITIHTSNAADTGTGADNPTRPTPPLSKEDLVRIAELAGLHW